MHSINSAQFNPVINKGPGLLRSLERIHENPRRSLQTPLLPAVVYVCVGRWTRIQEGAVSLWSPQIHRCTHRCAHAYSHSLNRPLLHHTLPSETSHSNHFNHEAAKTNRETVCTWCLSVTHTHTYTDLHVHRSIDRAKLSTQKLKYN